MLESDSADYWFVHYKHDILRLKLIKAFQESEPVEYSCDIDFRIQVPDSGSINLEITFQVIRLVFKGETKDFIVSNFDSIELLKMDGTAYLGIITNFFE